MNSRKQIIGSVAAVTVAVSFSAASVTPAASTRVASTVVRTWTCKIDPQPVEEAVRVAVSQAKVSISTGSASSPENWVSFRADEKGYKVGDRCQPISKRVVMSRNHLDLSAATHFACSAPTHVWIRLALTLDSNEFPQTARIEITQSHARFHPLAQLDWGNGKPVVYSGVACASGY